MDGRPVRRNLALTIAALLFAVPSLVSCGFNYATDREYTPANGANDQDGIVDVLNAVIVSQDEGSGTFLASLANNDPINTIHMTALDFGSNSTIEVADFDPVEIKPHQAVNLADGQGIKVQGDFAKGDFLPLAVVFDNGESASLQVLVVDATDQWEGMDNATGTPAPQSGAESPTKSPTETS
jgi:hypothetical protein